MNINQFNVSENIIPPTTSVSREDNFDSKQNSVVEIEAASSMECDTSENLGSIEDSDSANNNTEDFRARIPRSASCPIPNVDNDNSSEENNSLSMSWSMLFESEDSGKLYINLVNENILMDFIFLHHYLVILKHSKSISYAVSHG